MQRAMIIVTTSAEKERVEEVLAPIVGFARAVRPIGSTQSDYAQATHWVSNYASAPSNDYQAIMDAASGELSGAIAVDVLTTFWGDIDHVARVDGVLKSMGLELIPDPDL